MLETALEIGEDPEAGLVDKVVAWQAAHGVRADLQHRGQLIGVQCRLVHGLEDLDDPAAAYQVAAVATEALAEYRASGPSQDDLEAAILRLARIQQSKRTDPLINTEIAAARAGGAATGLEARIWAVIDLLSEPDQRQRALELADQIAAELSRRGDLGSIGNRWRLLLAFHPGRAGYPAMAQQLLTSMLPRQPGTGFVREPRRDRRLQQHPGQGRGAFGRHVPVGSQQHRRGVQHRPVRHRSWLRPGRRRRGHRPAALAPQRRQQVLRDVPHDLDIPDLRP